MKRTFLIQIAVGALLAGVVVGGIRAASRPEYTLTDLGQPSELDSAASDINDLGQTAGYRSTPRWKSAFREPRGRASKTRDENIDWSEANGINRFGELVGTIGMFENGVLRMRAVQVRAGQIQEIRTLGGDNSMGYGINDQGQVVGMSQIENGPYHACLYSDSVLRDLGTLGGSHSAAYSINSRGQVVGTAQTDASSNHAFLYEQGRMRDLGTLGGIDSCARDINDRGDIVGQADTPEGSTHAFLYRDSVLRDLGTLPMGSESIAYGLNSQGEVVGTASLRSGEMRAFLWRSGRMRNLNTMTALPPGWTLIEARAINDAGCIVGFGLYNGSKRAFLLTPRG